MALIYRAVPSLTATMDKFNSISRMQTNLEGIIYDLGYISFEDVYPFFKQDREQKCNTFDLLNEYYKFFFLFPYDALIKTFSSIESICYSEDYFDLLEYDVPKEILLEYCGYGFYNGQAHVEFCIPESEFQKNSSTTLDTKSLKNQLSMNKELSNVSHYEGKRAYKTNFVTRKRILYDAEELYDEHDFLSFQRIIDQLNQKGIISPNNINEIYEMFKIQSYDVYRNKEYKVKELQRSLEKILKK